MVCSTIRDKKDYKKYKLLDKLNEINELVFILGFFFCVGGYLVLFLCLFLANAGVEGTRFATFFDLTTAKTIIVSPIHFFVGVAMAVYVCFALYVDKKVKEIYRSWSVEEKGELKKR